MEGKATCNQGEQGHQRDLACPVRESKVTNVILPALSGRRGPLQRSSVSPSLHQGVCGRAGGLRHWSEGVLQANSINSVNTAALQTKYPWRKARVEGPRTFLLKGLLAQQAPSA
eukprot:1158202-Pelagomonas_calceolata.AAC.9